MKRLFLILFAILTLSACSELELPSTTTPTADQTLVHVVARAPLGETTIYPIHVYAFDKSGKTCAHQTITSATQPLNLAVPKETDLQIVAVSADEVAYDLPQNPTIQSLITLQPLQNNHPLATGYCKSTPLMLGKADIHTSAKGEANLNIQLNFAVTSLRFNFYSLPEECNTVVVSVDKPYSGVIIDGSHPQNAGITRIVCPKGSDEKDVLCCTSGEVFMFPTMGSETVFTISYNHDGEQYSTATYAAALRPGAPYVINGTYKDGAFRLSGAITPSEWESPTILDFTMTDGSSSHIGDEPDTPDDKPDVNPGSDEEENDKGVPKPFSVWNGHVVMAVEPNESDPAKVNVVLLSKSDRVGVPSAFNESASFTADDYAKAYSEGDLKEWTIPTEAEARMLYNLYSENADAIDAALSAADADPISTTDEAGKNVRYLCENAEKTFSFKVNTVLPAGKTVKDYRLRLLSTVTLPAQ